MKAISYTITDSLGIHARPAGELVRLTKQFSSDISIEKDGKTADAKKIFAVMSLAAKQGDLITVRIEGADESSAAIAVEQLLKSSF